MAYTLRIGDLRHRLELQQLGAGQSTYGEPNGTWATTTTVWGAVAPLGGREMIEGKRRDADVTHRITVRYQTTGAAAGISHTWRVKWGARLFDIDSVEDVGGRYHVWILTCREVLTP